MENNTPSWLFFGLLKPDKKWTPEKQLQADRIISSLELHANSYGWDENILKKVMHFDKNENMGYMPDFSKEQAEAHLKKAVE